MMSFLVIMFVVAVPFFVVGLFFCDDFGAVEGVVGLCFVVVCSLFAECFGFPVLVPPVSVDCFVDEFV